MSREAGNAGGCSAKDIRLALEATWRFRPGSAVDPWVSLGAGLEWATLGYPGGSGVGTSGAVTSWPASSETRLGIDLARVQVGTDFGLGSRFALGPYVGASLGKFTESAPAGFPGPGLHGWGTLGLRGTFDL